MFRNLAFSILIILIIAGAFFITTDLNLATEDEKTRISTRYEVEEKFKPDLATIILGVETENTDLDKAFTENNNKMNQVQKSLSDIEDIEIETLNFQVNPRKKIANKEEVSYYHVSNRIQVNSTDLDNLSSIIKNSIEGGANQVISINYTLKNKDKAKQKVVSKGIKLMKEEMQFIAEKMNREVGDIISITINDRFMGGNTGYRMKELAGAGEAVSMTPISVPDIRVNVSISAVFTLK